MFTGLIREIGFVRSKRNNILDIESSLKPKTGDSIAVNGACLTVTGLAEKGFRVELGDETQKIIPSEKFSGRVHLEPAMRMGEKFEGHIVQGHIDTIGVLSSITAGKNSIEYIISVDPAAIPCIAPKGSIAIDGVSLTVNDVGEDWFRLTLIPHTMKKTLFHEFGTGDKINIETDLFARYIKHILKYQSTGIKPEEPGWETIDAVNMIF